MKRVDEETQSLKVKPVNGRMVTFVPTLSLDEIVSHEKKLWAVYSHGFFSFL
jgi:hypothetical protein